jgi:hypothetical protein
MTGREYDFDELLRRADPVAGIEIPGPDSAIAGQILSRVLRKRRRRHLAVAVAAAIAVLASAVAAVAILFDGDVEVRQGLLCLDSADSDARRVEIPVPTSITADACAELWVSGVLANPDLAPPGAVPPLTGCVLGSGVLAVFPSDDPGICAELDLPAFERMTATDKSLLEEILALMPPGECTRFEAAATQVGELLERLESDRWTLRLGGEPTTQRPCASPSIDETGRTITLVPIPEAPSG